MIKERLMIPMYGLHYVRSVEDQKYNEDNVMFFRRDYELKKRQEIFEALEWAMENPDYDFKSFPSYEDLRHSNTDIFRYLKKLYEFMKENQLNEH